MDPGAPGGGKPAVPPTLSQPGEKPTNEELNARIHEVAAMLGAGLQRKEILRYATTKGGWNLARGTIDRYIRRAKDQLAKAGREKQDYILAIAKYRLDEIYARAMVDKDYDAAIEAVTRLCRLFGLPIDPPAAKGLRGAEPGDDELPPGRIAILVAPERSKSREAWEQDARAEMQPKLITGS